MNAKNVLSPDWYKALKGNAMYWPKSQGKAVYRLDSFKYLTTSGHFAPEYTSSY